MKITVIDVYQRLYNAFGPQAWWPANNNYEMLIGAILTQNTNWQNVEKALANLKHPITPAKILSLSQEDLASLIRPSGYHNQKAQRILQFTHWFMQYDGDIEQIKQINGVQLRAILLSLKGIGPETADCMLVYAFDKPFFIIDTYTGRLFERIGFAVAKQYAAFQLQIELALGQAFSLTICNEFHALIIRQGKDYCKATPSCQNCPLNQLCHYYQYRQ
ncbi:hypothetical protein RHO15_06150 [Utexia brackfieldae]|uniref:endonuclease III domain-containing protein n=1 Tax=Utexia brackfieldae TaxID=3074108 RepID=UPI00370DC715